MNYDLILQVSGVVSPILALIILIKLRKKHVEYAQLDAKCLLAEARYDKLASEERPPNQELQEFLHDVTAHGKAMIKVERMPMEGSFIWRGYNGAK